MLRSFLFVVAFALSVFTGGSAMAGAPLGGHRIYGDYISFVCIDKPWMIH